MTAAASTDRQPARRTPPIDAERATERLDALTARVARNRRVPHIAMSVASLDGSFRWQGAAGPAGPDGTPMRTDTPWFIASVTKLVILTSVLLATERGALHLEDPITAHLPPEVTSGLHRRDGVDRTSAITIRHLLGHTSGLPDFLEDRPKGGRSWYDRLGEGEDLGWGFDEVVARTRELRPRFDPQDLQARRQRARYSDTGFQLLIAILERIEGRPFHAIVEHRLTRPLGLRHTWLAGHSAPRGPVAPTATLYAGREPLVIPRALASTNDLTSTLDDVERLLRTLVTGAVFDDPATGAVAHERFNRLGYPLRYGLGMMHYQVPRLAGPRRRPVTLIGHSGATGTWLFHCPEVDLLLAGTVDQVAGRTLPFRIMPAAIRACLG